MIEAVSWNSDNIDYGEMIHVHDGTDEGVTTFFLADIRIWKGGVRQFLIDQQCEQDMIERIMAKEPET